MESLIFLFVLMQMLGIWVLIEKINNETVPYHLKDITIGSLLSIILFPIASIFFICMVFICWIMVFICRIIANTSPILNKKVFERKRDKNDK
jgi:hypothetical protein